MIVPMKKISLLTLGEKKEATLKTLRSLGMVHIEISEGSGEKLNGYKEQIALLERAIFSVGKPKKVKQKQADTKTALEIAQKIDATLEEKNVAITERAAVASELEGFKSWGEFDPDSVSELASLGVEIAFYETPKAVYEALPEDLKTVIIHSNKATVRFLLWKKNGVDESSLSGYTLTLPKESAAKMREKIARLTEEIEEANRKVLENVCFVDAMKKAIADIERDVEFETYFTGMEQELLSEGAEKEGNRCLL